MKKICFLLLPLLFVINFLANAQRTTINLNGIWDFEQTKKAFPPEKFTHKIPVPGLITLAKPPVEQDKKFLKNVKDAPRYSQFNLNYTPKYSWYRRKVYVPDSLKGTNTVLTLLKSKYGTQVYVNGKHVGGSMETFTPIDIPVTDALKFGAENEIMVRVGDLTQLSIKVSGLMDFEKSYYFPGIWDDVYLSFTDNFRVDRVLPLPSVANDKVTIKMLVRSFYPSPRAGAKYGRMSKIDTCKVEVTIREEESDEVVAKRKKRVAVTRRGQTTVQVTMPMNNAALWSPGHPFLYTAVVRLYDHENVSDEVSTNFGMRDFTRKGKYFYLNGQKIYLRGSNITLPRFFEDPDGKALPWNRQWVTNLLSNIPEKLHWNALRVCVGVVPEFWYDIADSLGILLQNERLYWSGYTPNSRVWHNVTKKIYTDWVWSDGNHASIVIWDAMNESYNKYIGQQLIPELRQLDPTRIWDNGYMHQKDLLPGQIDEMDEPHLYQILTGGYKRHPIPLGDLDYLPKDLQKALNRSAAQLVNEYNSLWLWRNGKPSMLNKNYDTYDYYLGKNNTTLQRRFLQAYWVQLETEWLRTYRSLAGVLPFDYLSNNYGYTGDWFIGDIKNLTPGPTLKWLRSAMAPSAVFIDLTDQRYVKKMAPAPYKPGSSFAFNLVGVNDYDHKVSGKVTVILLDNHGKQIGKTVTKEITIPAYGKQLLPMSIKLSNHKGGYLVLTKYMPDDHSYQFPVVSRRYIKIGDLKEYNFYNYKAVPLKKNKKQQIET